MNGYAIVIEQAADNGYGAWCPDLPGCVALGDTYDDCVLEMREAITFHLDGMRKAGEPIPAPSAVGSETVVVTA